MSGKGSETKVVAEKAKDIDPINYYFTSTIGDLISDYVAGRLPDDINQANIELRKSTLI